MRRMSVSRERLWLQIISERKYQEISVIRRDVSPYVRARISELAHMLHWVKNCTNCKSSLWELTQAWKTSDFSPLCTTNQYTNSLAVYSLTGSTFSRYSESERAREWSAFRAYELSSSVSREPLFCVQHFLFHSQKSLYFSRSVIVLLL